MKVSATRTGRIRSSYFGPLSFTTVGDPYIDPEKVLIHYEKEQKKLCNKEVPFKPPSGYKELVGSAYKHMKDYDYKKVESRKQTDGRVYSAPRNVTTNPICKVLDKSIPYITDDYNRYSDFERVFKLFYARKQECKARVKRRNSHFEVLYLVDHILIRIKTYMEKLRCLLRVRENLQI